MATPEHSLLSQRAFSLPDLLALVAVLLLGAFVLFPGLAHQQPAARDLQCRSNLRQLANGWMLYAIDHSGRVANNFGLNNTQATITSGKYETWASQVLSWDSSSMNTNADLLLHSVLTPYAGNRVEVFRCPSDLFVSGVQATRGWTHRLRSYSMNAFVGPYGPGAPSSANPSFSSLRQWLKLEEFPRPNAAFVFIEVHPDYINDGYFLNNPALVTPSSWGDVPGSFHEGACGITFADGHHESHAWLGAGTKPPVRFMPVGASLDAGGRVDYKWLSDRTAIPLAL
jgi:hypothetical protein